MTKRPVHIRNVSTLLGFRIALRHSNMILFSSVCAGYFLWRYLGFNYIVWDDTSSASYNLFANDAHYSLSSADFFVTALQEVFGNIQGDGYRPICAFIKLLGVASYTNPVATPVPFILFNALINGLLAVIYFNFSLHFVTRRLTALLAVIFLLFSTPFLTASLVTFSANQGVVPLLICAGILCYYKVIGENAQTWHWLTILVLIMLLGPLYREFVGLLPLLIMILEVQRARYVSLIMLLSLSGLVHALFPTALIKWVLFHSLPIVPVFAMGNLGVFLQVGTEGGNWAETLSTTISQLHWRIFVDIVSIYPPTMFVLFFLALWLRINQSGNKIIDDRVVFLLIFFSLSLLPFLKLFNEQVHLLYSLVPMSVLLAMAAEDLWLLTCDSEPFYRKFRAILVLMMIMILADHALNVYTVRKVTGDIYTGITKSANWFSKHVPRGTYVITNAHHLEDVRFYSRGHIEPWGAPGGIPDQRRWMHNASDLQMMIDERAGRDIYFFDVDITRPVGQRGEERALFYVRDKYVEMSDLGILYKIQSRYLFLDPLKHLIPIKEIAWAGPPDLEFDFYRGPSLDGAMFHREVYAEYHLYKVAGSRVMFFGPPQLLEQNYRGFNLVLFRDHVYAIPQPEGAFEIQRIEKNGYSRSFQASSIQEVKTAIDREFE